jgi:hypothetical protein
MDPVLLVNSFPGMLLSPFGDLSSLITTDEKVQHNLDYQDLYNTLIH